MGFLRVAVLDAPAAGLAWLGRQGTRAIAALVFIGIAVPPLDALLKPFVTEAIFVLLCLAFLRVDPAALRSYLGRPALVLAATAWTTLAIPAVFGVGCLAIGLDGRSPDLFLAPDVITDSAYTVCWKGVVSPVVCTSGAKVCW